MEQKANIEYDDFFEANQSDCIIDLDSETRDLIHKEMRLHHSQAANRYFLDVPWSDRLPVVENALTWPGGNAYETLTGLGIIKRSGTCKGEEVHYDPRCRSYVSSRSRKEFPAEKVRNRKDSGPSKCIRVLGDTDLKIHAKTRDNQSPGAPRRRRTMINYELLSNSSQNAAPAPLDSSGYEDLLETDGVVEDPDSIYPEEIETQLFLKSYITRSIALAAKHAEALVVCQGLNPLTKAIGRGVRSLVLGSDTGDVRLLGVYGGEGKNRLFREQPLRTFTHHLYLYTHHAEKGKTRPATEAEISDTIKEMIAELASGGMDNSKKGKPLREPCRVVTILCGGTDETQCKRDLLQSVQKRWPIFILEGSGGLAQELAERIHRVEEHYPQATPDDYRTVLGMSDPFTAEILINGIVTLVRTGMSGDEVARMIELGLMGDETLRLAWEKYATWSDNAKVFRQHLRWGQLIILLLSISTTTLSIVQTFLQLQFNADSERATNRGVSEVYQWVGLFVIALPIFASLAQTVMSQSNPAVKWTQLRRCSELLLREIYMYRSQTRKYSAVEILRSQTAEYSDLQNTIPGNATKEADDRVVKSTEAATDSDAPDPSDDPSKEVDEKVLETWGDDLPYTSRQELLQRRLAALTDELMEGCVDVTLKSYTGPLPPLNITKTGDDGWSDLEPEAYATFRLKPILQWYSAKSEQLKRQEAGIIYSVYIFGALGTMIAAVAVYDFAKPYNLQAWVALTTSLQNALTRYMDYTRVEWLKKKYIKTKEMLANVEQWWSQMKQPGKNPESQTNRNVLVSKVESLITDEVVDTSKQLRNAMAKMQSAVEQQKEQTEKMLESLKSREDLEAVKSIKKLGLTDLTAENIMAAMEDPQGHEAEGLKMALYRLNDHIVQESGINIGEEVMKTEMAKYAMDTVNTINDLSKDVLDEVGNLIDVNLGGISFAKLIPPDLMLMVKDKKLRRQAFKELKNADLKNISRNTLLSIIDKADREVMHKVKSLSQRQMLEAMKSMCLEHILEEFQKDIESLGVTLYDLIPTRVKHEELISELRALSSVMWQRMSTTDIVGLIKDPEIQGAMSKLGEAKVKGVLKRAQKLLFDQCPESAMLRVVMNDIAKLDMSELFGTSLEQLELLQLQKKCRLMKYSPSLLSKDEILLLLPPRIRMIPQVVEASSLQLQAYIEKASLGTATSTLIPLISKICLSSENKSLELAFQDPEKCERLLQSLAGLDQVEVNHMTKSRLLKRLALSPVFTEIMQSQLQLLSETQLQATISQIKQIIANTYNASVIDFVSQKMRSLDLWKVLPDPRLWDQLTGSLSRFSGLTIASLSRKEIFACFAEKDLILALEKTTDNQLQDIVMGVLKHSSNRIRFIMFMREFKGIRDQVPMALVDGWDQIKVERLIKFALSLSSAHWEDMISLNVKDQILDLISDTGVRDLFGGFDVIQIQHVLKAARSCCPNPHLCSVFNHVISDLPETLVMPFVEVFSEKDAMRIWTTGLTNFTSVLQGIDDPLTSHLNEITQAIFQECPALQRAFEAKSIIDSDPLRVIVTETIEGLLRKGPYYLFIQICESVKFDLRDLLPEKYLRENIVSLIIKLKVRDLISFEQDRVDPSGLIQTEGLSELERGVRELLDRKRFQKACTRLNQYPEIAERILKNFTDDQLRVVVTQVKSIVEGDDLGKFFLRLYEDEYKYEERLRKEASGDHKVHIRHHTLVAASSFKSFIHDDFAKINALMCEFEPAVFSSLQTAEKQRCLTRFLPSEDNIRAVTAFTQDEYTALFNLSKEARSRQKDTIGMGFHSRPTVFWTLADVESRV